MSAPGVSIDGIRAARAIVRERLEPTPLRAYPLLDGALGATVWLKHEHWLPTGSFKIRGGYHFMHHFVRERTHTGVITATRGNHGQSIALAARDFGVPATIVVPRGNNPEKNAAMRAYGARLIEHGRDFDEAREEVARLAAAENLRYVHSANEPHLIHGVGTYALEVLEALPAHDAGVDAIYVPIGLGSGICGVITAFRALSPTTRIVGVQADGAPCHYLSWRAGHAVTTPSADTFADGMATRTTAELTLRIILDGVDEVVLVSDAAIRAAIRLLWRTTHQLVEGAGAAAVAAIVRQREALQGKTVVAPLTGANLDSASIAEIFDRAQLAREGS